MNETYEITGLINGPEEKPVILGNALTSHESVNLMNEYLAVYGSGNIIFNMRPLSFKEYSNERTKAFANLIAALNGPVNKVINQLKNK